MQQQDVVTQEDEQMSQDIFPSFQTSSNVITMTKDAPLIGCALQRDVDNIERILRIVRAMMFLWQFTSLPLLQQQQGGDDTPV